MEGIKEIPKKPGIYQFRCVNEDGTPILISRLLKKDPAGIIYVGESDNLQRRIRSFWDTIKKKGRSRHAAAWTYVSFNYYPIFPPKNLQFRYTVVESPIAEEFDLLLSYLKDYMDLPPLNTNRGRYPNDWEKKWFKAFGQMPLSD